MDERQSGMASEGTHPFGALLRSLRVRSGLSQNQLARRAGVDPAYVNRLERASPSSSSLPSRKVVLALADTLDVGPVDIERLLVAAGLCPEAIVRLGGWDASLGDIADVLADSRLSHDDRAELRELLRIVAGRWRSRPTSASA
jgi:transcriptional regulator with XRE-family HTH domain